MLEIFRIFFIPKNVLLFQNNSILLFRIFSYCSLIIPIRNKWNIDFSENLEHPRKNVLRMKKTCSATAEKSSKNSLA